VLEKLSYCVRSESVNCCRNKMAASSIVPVPKELQIREGNVSKNWKKFETQWKYTGVEIVADDFLICGIGDSIEEATRDHDSNLQSFMVKELKTQRRES
jgi:hypothetical protein